MTILKKRIAILYRFKCWRCRSLFEMTDEEKIENDWEYTDKKGGFSREEGGLPHNSLNKFYCPVCERDEIGDDMRKISVMNDGSEVIDFL